MKKVLGILTFLLAPSVFFGVPFVHAASVSPMELAGALHWRSIGPYVGGRVTAVQGVPNKPNLYYAAYAGGGVWKTEDHGYHWKNISDGYFKSNNVGALAVAPSNPNIIYAGTGDSAIRNTVLTGDGMYKSTDAGKTWTHIGLADSEVIGWIVVDPNDPNTVYAAAFGHTYAQHSGGRGVYKSTDGGQTWKRVLYVNDETGALTLAMDPSNPQVLYATMWQAYRTAWTLQSGGPGSGIYKTTDGGATWKNITHNSGLPSGIFGKVGVAVAPSDPNVVYALIQANISPGVAGALYRSDNGGQSWAMINTSQDITQRSFYYMRVFVDPKDASTVYLPNVGVYVSHDSGKTLTALHPPHGDNHAFWINPNNPQIFIEGNDGGATVTQNGGQTWSSEDNQPTGQFYHANLDDQFPFHVYGSQQDESSAEGPSAVAQGVIPPVWTRIVGGEATWDVPTPGKPWITYGSGDFSLEWRENRRTELEANVSPWPDYKYGNGADALKYRYNWISRPKMFAPHNPEELLEAAQVVFQTFDQGANWKVISPDLTRNDKSKQFPSGGSISHDVAGQQLYDSITQVQFSPLNDNIIWTGSDDGLVYVTTDGGGHWNQVRPADLPTWSWVTDVDPSAADAGTAYMSASRYRWDDFHPYIYKTTDYGKHWTKVVNGIPDNQYVLTVRQDPNDPSLVFAGTNTTAYFSLDGGSHWMPLTLNLPVVQVQNIAIDSAQHAVVIATFGRAFWVLDNLQYLEQLGNAQVAGNAPYLFKPQQSWLVKRSTRSFGGPKIGGTNLSPGTAVFFHLPSDYSSSTPVKLSFTDANGKLINSYTFPYTPTVYKGAFPPGKTEIVHAGMNSFLWDMRYPSAKAIKGVFYAGFPPTAPLGPEIVSGTYYAVLDVGGTTQKQVFQVKLDPRLTTTQAELQQRLDLEMQIDDVLNRLATTLNQAIALRDQLQQMSGGGDRTKVLATLNKDIDAVLDLRIQAAEGSIVYPSRLYGWLTKLMVQVDHQYLAPTTSMRQVANDYFMRANEDMKHLQADIQRADTVSKR